MKLARNPELLDRLAADYLTGGMGGGARRRYEALLRSEPLAAQALQRWRERLDEALLPRGSPDAVWQQVQRRLGSADAPRWGLRAWRALALGLGGVAAGALALLLAVLLRGAPTPPQQLVAVLDGPAGHAAVLDVRGAHAALTAIGAQTAPVGKSFELWVLPRRGKPVAAGIVRLQGTFHMPMPPALLAVALQAKGFAISVEPQGGSPTGQPTGPVTYIGHRVPSAGAAQDT